MIQGPGSRRVGALTRQPLLSSPRVSVNAMRGGKLWPCGCGEWAQCLAGLGWAGLGWAGLGWAAGSDKIQVLEQAAAASQHQITRLMETRRH